MSLMDIISTTDPCKVSCLRNHQEPKSSRERMLWGFLGRNGWTWNFNSTCRSYRKVMQTTWLMNYLYSLKHI